MARKRQRRRAAGSTVDNHNGPGGANGATGVGYFKTDSGVNVNIRQINAGDEGVLYTQRIMERRGSAKMSTWSKLLHVLTPSRNHNHRSDGSLNSLPIRQRSSSIPIDLHSPRGNSGSGMGMGMASPMSPPPQTGTLMGFKSFYGTHQKQYTIASKKKYKNNFLNWIDKHHMNCVDCFCHHNEVDNNVYRPSTALYRYIDWTFTAGFTYVFMTFLFIYCVLCLLFGVLLQVAGEHEPNCIVASGEPFGATPHTKFSDAFALSWTTFTTVGYGMTYTSTGGDFYDTKPGACTWVVFLCLVEAFLGLLFAGMCAAILFGKVNRVQSHANLIFSNAVCLQYEEEDDDDGEDYNNESERSVGHSPGTLINIPPLEDDEENDLSLDISQPQALPEEEEDKFVDQFNGCPILKFQVVNELSNREGGELVDCIMKVVGIKFKVSDGKVTHNQYVRVNLVDFEHPFLSRVWHGVHILDSTSPLLTDRARLRIRENNGSWPSSWFNPDTIRSKLEFNDLIVTVAGVSNVSAVTVHAYKRYKIGDVLIGFNFAPIVFRDVETGSLETDLSMCNDVREQTGLLGEDLSHRRTQYFGLPGESGLSSTIRIKKSKSGDALGSIRSHHSHSSKSIKPSTVFSPETSTEGSGLNMTPEKDTSDDTADALVIPAGMSEETDPIANPAVMSDVPGAISPLEIEDPKGPGTLEEKKDT